jgi:hypothetical protein
MTLRPAGICCTPNSAKPFHPAMFSAASTPTRPHHSRGMRMLSPLRNATSSMPIAAKGSVTLRNVSGSSSFTPIFNTGQLQPQTSVRIAMGRNARAMTGAPADATARFISPIVAAKP